MAHVRLHRKPADARVLHEKRKRGLSRELRDPVAELDRLRAAHPEIRMLLRAANAAEDEQD